jgi:hypothetical protein
MIGIKGISKRMMVSRYRHIFAKGGRLVELGLRSMPRIVVAQLFRDVRGRVIVVIFVKVGKRLAKVFDLEIRGDGSKLKGMDLDRADESWEGYLLEFVVDEGADALSQSLAVRTRGCSPPIDLDGHHMCSV